MNHEYLIYIAGKFKNTKSSLTVKNPYSGEKFASTFLAGELELEKAIEEAVKAQEPLSELSSFDRSKILLEIASELLKNRDRLTAVLSQESAKPYKYALNEVNRTIQTFAVAAEEAKRLPKEYISLDWTESGKNKEGIIKYFPIGLIAGITPFNFPLNLVAHKVAPALAAGNPIIIKPASNTPISCLELAILIDKTDLPKGAFSVLPMSRSLGNKLVTDSRIKMLSFTGSAAIGWQMKKDAGKKKTTLELGGNAAAIITPTCNIELAAQKCVTGAFAYSGQVCIKVQRIYVQEKLFSDFTKTFISLTKKLKRGDPLQESTDISVMIDQKNADRVENWVNTAIEGGAIPLLGGEKEKNFYPPTVLTNTNKFMDVSCNEIFGPVVIIEPYRRFEEAITYTNDSPFGLQAGVFTNEISEMDQAFKNLDVGGVIINDVPTLRLDHMPYGGIKDSGLGREGIKYAIQEMMEPKILVKSSP